MPPIFRIARGQIQRTPLPPRSILSTLPTSLLVHNNLMSQILPYVENVVDLIHLYQTSPVVQQLLGQENQQLFAHLLLLLHKATPFKSDHQRNGFVGMEDWTISDISNILSTNSDFFRVDGVRIEMNPGNWLTLNDLVKEIRAQYSFQGILLIGFNSVKVVILCKGYASHTRHHYNDFPSYFPIEIYREEYAVYEDNGEYGPESNIEDFISLDNTRELNSDLWNLSEYDLDSLQEEKSPLLNNLDLFDFHNRIDYTCVVLELYKANYQGQNIQWAMGYKCE